MTTTTTSAATSTPAIGGQSLRPGASLASNFDGFLKLLTAQLEHQDPLSPLDATQFTSQLVQFSTVEQALRTNSQLEKLTGLLETDSMTSALDFIGLDVGFEAEQLRLAETGNAGFTYQLARPAAEARITIRDARGAIVREAQADPGAGAHAFAWDGKGADGRRLPAGVYRVEVVARDEAGETVDAGYRMSGRVEGVETGSGGLRLLVGGVPVPLDRVRDVVRPAASAG
jgi:flagellar basal-body rod modification protein FlgD